MPRFTKEFESYEACTRWLYDHGFKPGVVDEMQNGDVVLYLEGDDAKRARDEDLPLAPGGFHLIEMR